MTKDSEITKVQIVIRRFLWETKDIVKDPAESQRWLSKFRNTLEFQDLEELPSKYALLLLAEAKSFNNTKKRNAQMKWVRESLEKEGFKKPTQEQLDERWIEMYGQDELTAGAPNGNNGDVSATACGNNKGRSPAVEGSARFPGSAGERPKNLGSGKPVSTPTISTSGPRQAGNAAAEATAPSSGGSAARISTDGDIREDSQDRKSGTSANHYGDAPHREAGDESATVSRNMRRVPQNEAPAHVFSGGRTAQGTMSPSPSGAAQDGNNLGSARPSTDGDTRKDSHGHASAGNSVMAESGGTSVDQSYAQALDCLSDKASDQAASNTGNAQPVACRESGKFKRKYGEGNTANVQPSGGPEDGKFEVTTKKPNGVCADAGNGNAPEDCKSATSAQPLRPWKEVVEKSLGMTGNDKRPAGGSTPSSSSLVPPACTVDVLSLAYSGEFQNVLLTQEQYAELGIRFGNQQKLNRAIDSLSCKLENEEIKPVPKNHYALLLKWASYREDMEEKKELEDSKPKMTNMEKTWIAAMKRVEAM